MIIFRTELKYQLPLSIYNELRNSLIPFTVKDAFTEPGKRFYPVHSIYYDTLNLNNYYTKIEGEDEREKFRIRFYNEEKPFPDKELWFELKQKRGPTIKKLRHKVLYKDLKKIMSQTKNEPKLAPILQNVFTQRQMPLVKISYLREALSGRFERDTRITFDTRITGNYSPIFNTQKTFGNKPLINPMMFVLEIKTSDSIPTWLSHIIERFGLELNTFSKYANGIENCSIERKLKGLYNIKKDLNYEF